MMIMTMMVVVIICYYWWVEFIELWNDFEPSKSGSMSLRLSGASERQST